ncbi:hypothetical protein DAPPUDRAFT_106275 [Daphnia pulex]|uniref:Uncharacterized protein n=1 Tax=Daphnia pulex TaxID=6669 RepID=E9GT60_DAPPU|nr:hypothetical protein DAPPUDRAFT_106275 [Daphnia pulex]|eukprot:EFX77311.1 hypothetical protein DAPPUDRAFT_106275 [Daphnia pulex]
MKIGVFKPEDYCKKEVQEYRNRTKKSLAIDCFTDDVDRAVGASIEALWRPSRVRSEEKKDVMGMIKSGYSLHGPSIGKEWIAHAESWIASSLGSWSGLVTAIATELSISLRQHCKHGVSLLEIPQCLKKPEQMMNDYLDDVLTCSVCFERLCLLKCIQTSDDNGNVKRTMDSSERRLPIEYMDPTTSQLAQQLEKFHQSCNRQKNKGCWATTESCTKLVMPQYGIPCILEDFTNVPVKRWKLIIEASWLTLDIGQLQNGSYPANFAGNSADGKVATSLRRIQVPEREVIHVPQQAIQPATAAPIPVPEPVVIPAPPPVLQPRTGGGIENVKELIFRFFCRHLKVSPQYTSTRDENTYSHRVSITIAGLPELDENFESYD